MVVVLVAVVVVVVAVMVAVTIVLLLVIAVVVLALLLLGAVLHIAFRMGNVEKRLIFINRNNHRRRSSDITGRATK